ncbi:MAG: alpha/beta hydrolase [Myxococcales bacterium]|nr:alpha/beta hydrolase [Myxococcales bacterium]
MKRLAPALAPVLALVTLVGGAACTFEQDPAMMPDAGVAPGADAPPDTAGGCVPGLAGAPCVLDLHDAAIAGCEPGAVGKLRAALDERANLGPLWSAGRALFRTDQATHVAGDFNGWSQTALTSAAVCNTDLFVAVGPVAKGYWAYKLFDGQTWSLDPQNPAFAYDDFSGNLDGKNSVLNTPGSGKGHLVKLARACSSALGNCREVTAYYPRDYTAPETGATTYPVLFMHDGQNLWDDHDCCFNHTGWEINVALDAEIAAGRVAPVIVIGAASTTSRNNEYGLSPTAMAAFMTYQVEELQPQALAQVRWNREKVAVGGSSLGGLVSMHLALTYPQTYGAAASLSGAFWPGQDQGFALRDKLPVYGKQALAVYVDSGGNVAQNSDGAADTAEVRDLMAAIGWTRSDSPSCAPGPNALCYHFEPGATHDELAWKARTWRFLRFLFPAT